MSSGRKNRVVISCVTFETAKITDPVDFYQATHVHLIWYAEDPRSDTIYRKFYERVCEIIKEQSPFEVKIEEHIEKVYYFTDMLRTVLSIIQKEKDNCKESDIYVNISAGTHEYSAAAAIASMMTGAIPFSVGTAEHTVQDDAVFFENEKPVGLTKKAKDPYLMPYYPIEMPERYLVRALRVLEHRNSKNLSVTGAKMTEALMKRNIWLRGEMNFGEEKVLDETEKRKKKKKEESGGIYVGRSDVVYYHRDYVDKWLKKGWVRKNEFKRYEVSDTGKKILEIFYVDDDQDLRIDGSRSPQS